MKDTFDKLALKVSEAVGHPYTFFAALFIVLVWLLSGPIFHFSDTWQLLINTGTTIITNLIVFLIQNTENRNSEALHIKLDEIIRAIPNAKNNYIDIETLSEAELKKLHEKIKRKIK